MVPDDKRAPWQSEEDCRVILEQIDEIVYRVDVAGGLPAGQAGDALTGSVMFVSAKVKSIIGCEPDDFIRDAGLWFRMLHPDDRAAVAESTRRILAGREPGLRVYRLRHRHTGEYRWMEDKVVPLTDEREGVIGILGVARDITDRKRAEEELRRNRDRLEAVVKKRTAELEAVNKELEAFAHSISHDLRAPLRSMDGFSRMLLEDYGNKLDERGRDHLERVRAGAYRMAKLIEDLLNFSRLSRSEMRRERVNLSALAESVAAGLKKSQPGRSVEFIIAPGLTAKGDRRLLRAALEHLLGNAYKFTGNRPQAVIEFGAAEREGRPVFFVRDNGAGFDMAYAGKLFGAFQRLHSTAEFPGAGIGLVTVQRIIHRHGGRIWAEGAVDRGATFYFTIEGSWGGDRGSADP